MRGSQKFNNILIDDVLFYIAVIMLIAGTGLLYADTPLIYLQVNVEAGRQRPPADIVPKLIRSLKLQDALAVLLGGTIFGIKYWFLFFFRHLIWQSKPLKAWWWCIFVICIPAAVMVMFSELISCSYFDEHILGQS